jgi:hypothetical protein
MKCLAILAAMTLATPAAARDAQSYYCELSMGNLASYQYVSLAGVAGPRTTVWNARTPQGGINLMVSWTGEAAAAMIESNFVAFSYRPARSGRYRIELRPGEGLLLPELFFTSDLKRTNSDGLLWFTDWRTLTAAGAGMTGLRAIVISANGRTVREDALDAESFGAAFENAMEIQPEMNAMVAGYRQRCRVVAGDGPLQQVPPE